MITSKVFHKKTRRGNIVKVVREHYLRDDIGCGLGPLCTLCSNLCLPKEAVFSLQRLKQKSPSQSLKQPHIFVVDANVALHQIDILQDDVIGNVIIPQTVFEEVKKRSPPAYKKLKDLFDDPKRGFYLFYNEFHQDTYVEKSPIESNDTRNERAVRKVLEWFSGHLKQLDLGVNCVLLSDSKESLEKAQKEHFKAISTSDYVRGIENRPDLEDMLAANEKSEPKQIFGRNKTMFTEYLPMSDLKTGLKNGQFFQGTYQASRDNYLEGTIFVESEKFREIFIQGLLNINRAIHEDLIVVELLPENEWSCPMALLKLHEMEKDHGDDLEADDEELAPGDADADAEKSATATSKSRKRRRDLLVPTGRVVGVVRRNWRPYCGMLDVSPVEGATRHLFVAAERRIPRVRIETRQALVLSGQRIVVCIDSWPRDSRYPKGHYVKTLGVLGDRETEREVILLEHDVEHGPFSDAIYACLPEMPWIITDKDRQTRMDLRHLNICSVDPPGCTDIDDALHCRKLEENLFEIGIHIADVSHFVRPGTAMDLEASKRGTTVYLTDKRIDMLPDLLSSNLCSLRSNVERFAFSVICKVTPDGDIVSSHFGKSIIESKASLTYAQAQARIDDPKINDDLTQSLRHLNQIAKKLKLRRKGSGALSLASLEIRFKIDTETRDPIDVEAKQLLDTHSLVEEFMLMGNIAVAQRIFEEFPDCAVLRRHPVPQAANYEPLIHAASSRGFKISAESGLALSQSLEKAQLAENPFFNTMLRILTTRCMTQAVYFCSGTIEQKQFYHFGLASPIYTHFTSPIRRYADLIVHRFLASAVGALDTYPDLLDMKKQEICCRNLNFRHKMAQLAGRASVLSNTHMFFKERREDLEAYVLGVRKNALQVLVPKYGLESAILLNKSHPFTFNEEARTLTSGDICLHMFDKITVRISVDDSDKQHYKLKLQLVEPKVENFSVEPIMDLGLDENLIGQNEQKFFDRNPAESERKRIKT